MAKVKMLTGLSGPAGSYGPGDEYECDAQEAARLIEGGHAEAIAANVEKAVKPDAPVKRKG